VNSLLSLKVLTTNLISSKVNLPVKEVNKMALNEFDEHCKKIFAFLVLNDVPVNFNKLFRALNDSNYKISKPTLSAHLKHLLKHKVIKKKKDGKQKIAYSINYEKVDNLQFHKDFSKTAEKIIKSKENFNSFDVPEKITYVSFILMIIELNRLKNEIRSVLEPERRFEATLAFLFVKSYLERFRMYLLQTCVNSKEDAQKALVEIDLLEQKMRNEVF
jgi:DNA-binding transcriptional ArsR family regulator